MVVFIDFIQSLFTFVYDFSYSLFLISLFFIGYYFNGKMNNKMWLLFQNMIFIIIVNLIAVFIYGYHLENFAHILFIITILITGIFWNIELDLDPYIFEKHHWFNLDVREVGHTNDIPDIKKVVKNKIIKHYHNASIQHDSRVKIKENIKSYNELLKKIFNKNKSEYTKGIYVEKIQLLSKKKYLDSFHFELKLKIEIQLDFDNIYIKEVEIYINNYISNAILIMYKDVKRTKMLNRNTILFKSTNRSPKCRSAYNKKITKISKVKQFFILNCFIEVNKKHNKGFNKTEKSTYFKVN